MVEIHSGRTACLECDLLVDISELARGQRACCPRCDRVLTSRRRDGFTRSLAFALTAAILLIMANAFPFLELRSSGLEKVMTLPGTAAELVRDDEVLLALFVMAPIVVIPGLMLATLIALLIPLRRRVAPSGAVLAGRVLSHLGPWSMVEVFIIGVLVSFVKVAELATLVVGLSFWAYLGFVICFTASISYLDRYAMWRAIERFRA